MKKLYFLIATLLGVGAWAIAEEVQNYLVDFNTTISTSDHTFVVADGWAHVVDAPTDAWGAANYVTYGYRTTGGYNSTGGLFCGKQEVSLEDEYYETYPQPTKDALVTPAVSGTISLKVKPESTSIYSYVALYTYDESTKKVGTQLKKFAYADMPEGTAGFSTISYTVEEPQRIALVCSSVIIDDFTATTADIVATPKITIASVTPSATTGVTYFNENNVDGVAQGTITLTYEVTVKNEGSVTVLASDSRNSISLVNKAVSGTAYGAATRVNQTLEPGATSEPVTVTATIPIKGNFSYSGATIPLVIRENISSTTKSMANVGYKPYEAKFYFNTLGSTSSSSMSDNIAFGFVTESATKNYQIYNPGNAPLRVKSITLPAAFTCSVSGDTVVAPGEKLPVTVSFPATQHGSFSGDFTVTYIDHTQVEQTWTKAISGTVLGANTWYADFNNPDKTSKEAVLPEGSVRLSGIDYTSGFTGSYGNFDLFIKSYGYAGATNYFFTPKLSFQAGEEFAFDVAKQDTGGEIKVYLTKDRYNLGDSAAVYKFETENTNFTTRKITVPEAGEYYVAFYIYKMRLDNLVGGTKVEVAHDLYFTARESTSETQAGKEVNTYAQIIPLTNEAADSYTVTFNAQPAGGEIFTAALTSQPLVATSATTKDFTYKFNPEVNTTTIFNTWYTFNMGGTIFESPRHDIKVIFEPKFCFVTVGSKGSDYAAPVNVSGTIDFGKTNKVGTKLSYDIFNWGKAPLTVTNVSVPEGFAVNYTEATIPAKTAQTLEISVATSTPGTYEGNLVVTYLDAAGAPAEFSIPLKVMFLDPAKWYDVFTTTTYYPAGTILEKGITLTNDGKCTYISNSSSTPKMFITPKLRAEAGEKMNFEAKLYSTSASYTKGKVAFYVAPTREALLDASETSTRVFIGEVGGKVETEGCTVTAALSSDPYQSFTMTFPEAGEFYVGLALSDGLKVANVFGLTPVAVASDLKIASVSVPATAMQNNPATATVNLNNFGINDVAANDYRVIAHVGNFTSEATGVAVPMQHQLDAAPVAVQVPFMSPKVGEQSVYFEVVHGDAVYTSEPTTINVTKETVSSEKSIGTYSGCATGYAFQPYYKQTQSIALYSAAELGLAPGQQINNIVWKGYDTNASSSSLTHNVKIYYAWVDNTTLAQPGATAYDVSAMTLALEDPAFARSKRGSTTEHVKLIELKFEQPLVYEEGKSLLIYLTGVATGYNNGFNIEYSTTTESSFARQKDGDVTTSSWDKKNKPMIYLGLSVSTSTVSGNVTDGGAPVEGAVVTFIANDGSNVQYEATTGADGAYAVEVLQNSRIYDVEVAAGARADFAEAVDATQVATQNFQLADYVAVNPEATHTTASEDAYVKVDLGLEPGHNFVTLPFNVAAEQVETLFGLGAHIYTFGIDNNTNEAQFISINNADGMVAGRPYLVDVIEASTARLRTAVVAAPEGVKPVQSCMTLQGTFAPHALEANEFRPVHENFIETAANRAVVEVPAFSAYFAAPADKAFTGVRYQIVDQLTGIDTIAVDEIDNRVVYNLQGIRVTGRPTTGFYIVDGRKTFVR